MKENLPLELIHAEDVNLWAHVGVLEKERLMGQYFLLDFSIWVDLSNAAKNDALSSTCDYSIAIKGLQQLAFSINCSTIEFFSEEILNFLEGVYGKVPIQLSLKKCNPPINGFSGSVSIKRNRNFTFPYGHLT